MKKKKKKSFNTEITLKIKYNTDNLSRIIEYIKNYNNVLRFAYNRLYDISTHSMSTKDLLTCINSMNNVFIDTYFKNGAMYEARSLISNNEDNKVIFGGRKLFIDKCQHKISKEDFEIKKLHPLQVVGASYNKGNCKFQIMDEHSILFKPCASEHFILHLESVGRNYEKYLSLLIEAQNSYKLPITYKLGIDYVYITFDITKLIEVTKINPISNRIFAIDMNPNYIGYSVVDWVDSDGLNVVSSGVISNKPLTDYEKSLSVSSDSEESSYIHNKRQYETTQIAHRLTKLAKHFQCELFAIEDLEMLSKDNKRGKAYNRLINNQWNRNRLLNIIKKDCALFGISVQAVAPNYSSFVGNLVYRNLKLPDMILSSIEISRRCYEFYHQYIIEDKEKTKNIILNSSSNIKSLIDISLEELAIIVSWTDIKDLYYKLKKMKCNYRFPLADAIQCHAQSLFSKEYKQCYIKIYEFL